MEALKKAGGTKTTQNTNLGSREAEVCEGGRIDMVDIGDGDG